MKYIPKHQNHGTACLFPLAILILHENDIGKNDIFESIFEPQHDLFNPALQNQHQVRHGMHNMRQAIAFMNEIEARSNVRRCV